MVPVKCLWFMQGQNGAALHDVTCQASGCTTSVPGWTQKLLPLSSWLYSTPC